MKIDLINLIDLIFKKSRPLVLRFRNYLGQLEIRNSRNGFTLIEAVVATAVFATILSAIIGVYLSAIQIDRKTRSQRAVVQNARYISEFLAREVRNGTIDYSGTNGCYNTTTTLCVVNQAGEIESIALNGTDLVLTKNSASTNLNSASVKVTKWIFYTSPDGNPFVSSRTYNEQPRVTVMMELTSNYGANPVDNIKINLETTVGVRVYPAR
jgi:prepilin-type N-terminal cleavage/methylation domain-containing protein